MIDKVAELERLNRELDDLQDMYDVYEKNGSSVDLELVKERMAAVVLAIDVLTGEAPQ